MAMVCPQCNGFFEQRWHCPSCGVRLLYQSHQTRPQRGPNSGGDGGHWQQTPWGRICIGLLLAQGLYYGLRQLCTAGLLATSEDGAGDVWNTLFGLIFIQGLQGVGLLVGGMLTGAGRRQGAFYGAVVGVWNGVISIVVASQTSMALTPVALYGQPILQTAFGAIGGLLGSLIWRPLPRLTIPGDSRPARLLVPSSRKSSLLSGPVSWWRILAGIAVAVGGSLWANVILELVMEGSEGRLSIDSHLQATLVTWEIVALALLGGGALAGATSANGIKQGLLVGLGVAVVSAGIRMGAANMQVEPIVFSTFAALALGLVGGWFGHQLFPPIMRLARPRGIGPASM
jgi:hypothetical protein